MAKGKSMGSTQRMMTGKSPMMKSGGVQTTGKFPVKVKKRKKAKFAPKKK